MEKNNEERIPFRIESQRGDDIVGTNTETGAVITDNEAKEKGVPFESGVPRSKIQEAIEAALKQEKWVCVEKTDGTTELLTKKDLVNAEDVSSTGPAAKIEGEKPKEIVHPGKEEWKGDLKPIQVAAKQPALTTKPLVEVSKPKKEEWVSKFANITCAQATHKGKGG
jgi:hypothetical protein